MGCAGEMTHLPTRLESTFWSWRSGWSFSGGEATAIAAADALRGSDLPHYHGPIVDYLISLGGQIYCGNVII